MSRAKSCNAPKPPPPVLPTVVRYSGSLILNGQNQVLLETRAQPARRGHSYRHRTGHRWSYPNLHGDITVTADQTGTRSAGVLRYDPFGQPIDPTTGRIGTTIADDAGPDTLPGQADWGWVGSAPQTHRTHRRDPHDRDGRPPIRPRPRPVPRSRPHRRRRHQQLRLPRRPNQRIRPHRGTQPTARRHGLGVLVPVRLVDRVGRGIRLCGRSNVGFPSQPGESVPFPCVWMLGIR